MIITTLTFDKKLLFHWFKKNSQFFTFSRCQNTLKCQKFAKNLVKETFAFVTMLIIHLWNETLKNQKKHFGLHIYLDIY